MEVGTKRKFKAGLIVSTVFLVGTLMIIFFAIPISMAFSDSNTIELTATVHEVTKDSRNNCYLIATKEYSTKLVLHTDLLVNQERFSELKEDDTIQFRLSSGGEKILSDKRFDQIAVFSLKTDSGDISTLESFNLQQEKNRSKTKTFSIALVAMFTVIDILCILRLCGVNLFKKGSRL